MTDRPTRTFQLSRMEFEGFSIAGYSVGGEETIICVPELDVAFDIGRAPRESLAINNILLSHGHMDHIAGIGYYFSQRDFQGMSGGKAFVPAPLAKPLEKLMTAWAGVEGHHTPHQIIPMKAGDEYELRRNLIAKALEIKHVGPSLGYSVVERRRKLLEQYSDLTGPEIVELKKQGTEITRTIEYPLVSFLGDTGPRNFSDVESVRDSRVLLIECTFFDSDHVKRARLGKHLHVSDLPAILEGMNNEHIVITHVTRRTNMAMARKALKKSLSKEVLEKVSFLMSRKYIESE